MGDVLKSKQLKKLFRPERSAFAKFEKTMLMNKQMHLKRATHIYLLKIF